ncbi:MAG TPA: hypothetical protein PKC45_04300 [Gemmatales bacterium]|nr:hypothetical protein [Gemmatales bacterium]
MPSPSRSYMRWRLAFRLFLIVLLFALCFIPGAGPQGSFFNGDVLALPVDEEEIPVPEIEALLVPALLALVGRAGARIRRTAVHS